jgi:hypothetical protein
VNEGGLWERHISHFGGSMNGTWWEGSSTGDPEGYAKYGSGNERRFGGHSFPRAFDRRVKFIL